MDRVSQLRDLAGSSHDSSLDSTATPTSEAFHTANESSKFFSLSDVDTTLDITPVKNVSTEESFTEISPITSNSDLLDSYRLGSHIEASKILSGGVDIFDDNSYDGNELVIDDNVNVEFHEDSKLNSDVKNNVEDCQDAGVAVGTSDETVVAANDTTGVAEDTVIVAEDPIIVAEETVIVAKDAISAPEDTVTVTDNAINASEDTTKVAEDMVGTPGSNNITVAEVTDCEAEDTVCVAEDTVGSAENTITIAEGTVSGAENTVSVAENLVGAAEDTITVVEDTVSGADNTVSVLENIISAAEDPITAVEDTVCGADDTITVAENTVCAAEDIITVADDTVCATEDIITVADDTECAAEDTVIAVEDTVVAAQDTDEVAKKTAIAVDDTITVADETVADAQDTTGVAQETAAVGKAAEVCGGTEEAKEPHRTDKDTLVPIVVTPSEEREVVLPLNGELVSALDVGNGLYLYRQDGAELTVVQKLQTDNAQADFRYLKVRESGGYLEVYEEIEVQVTDKAPGKKVARKSMSHLPVNDISKAFCDSKRTTGTINKNILNKSTTSTSTLNTTATIGSEVKVKGDAVKSDAVKSKPIRFGNESKKSHLVETITPIQQSTCIQESIPSTETMVDLKSQQNCSPDMSKKDIEVRTEKCEAKECDVSSKIDNSVNEDTIQPDDKLLTEQTIDGDSNFGNKDDKKEIKNKITEPIKIGKPTTDTTRTQINMTNINPESTNKFAVKIKENIKTNNTNVGLVSLPTEVNDDDKEAPASKVDLKLCPKTLGTKDIKVASTENDKTKLPHSGVLSTHSEISKLEIQKESCVGQDKSNLNKEVPTLNKKTDGHNINSKDSNVNSDVILISNLNDTDNSIDTKSSNVDNKSNDSNLKLKAVDSAIMPKTEKCQDLQTLNPADADKTTTQDKLEDKKYVNKYITDALGIGKATTSLETLKSKELIKVDSDKPKEYDNMPKPKLVQEEKAKSINNNNPVPFGQWTEANKQEYLNKIKESKSTVSTSTNQIKHSNDLNRRDVLKKIDSARQTSNLNSNLQKKDFTSLNKLPLKGEVKYKPTSLKMEPAHKVQSNVTNTMCDVNISKMEGNNRTEMFNQDLIDKTIEGILMDKVPNVKPTQNVDSKRVISHEQVKEIKKYPTMKSVSLIDDIEQKMNELHGKPLIERAGHKLPQRFNPDVRNYQNADSAVSTTSMTTNKESSTIASKLPILTMSSSNSMPKVTLGDEGHSEEEILECEPVTGDSDVTKSFKIASSPGKYTSGKSGKSSQSSKSQAVNDTNESDDFKNNEATSIITENEFDKFARRNSITCENQLTVNFDSKLQPSIVKLGVAVNKSKPVITDTNNEADNKNYPSKLQLAYNSVLTAKRQQGSPITDIEDQPVKVVFIESSNDFIPYKLNVQGTELTSSSNKTESHDIETLSSCDSMDSDLNVVEQKTNDDSKIKKVKHQRKQVLTPVDTPDLELIEPKDLGITSPKRKRKNEDFKKIDARNNHLQRSMKSIPKKSYLLGRNNATQEKLKPALVDSTRDKCSTTYDVAKESVVQSLSEFKDSSNNIDSLVMAAELLEKQPDVAKAIVQTNTSGVSQNVPSKRGRGRPRKYPIQDERSESSANDTTASPQKRTKNNDKDINRSESDTSGASDDEIIKENWTMGKINDNIICPICNKLFRSENVVFKHVKHCTGPSPNRSESSANRSLRKRCLSYAKSDRSSSESDSDVELREITESDNKKSISKVENKAVKASMDADNIIVIDDTPPAKKEPKDTINKHSENNIIDKNPPKTSNSVLRVGNLVCEFCGKKFRQLSYLVNHKRLHEKVELKKPVKDDQNCDKKSVFECDVCHKEFRRLHNLDQHKISHNLKKQRKTSVDTKSLSTVKAVMTDKDHNAGFRCEQCDKSFRKLHHLVEHRETHGGTNKLKTNSNQPITDKTSAPPPQCTVCSKTFRKLHHLIEHKEQHNMESSRCDNKKNTLLAKDIIHECSLCYMVFPNEHSLEKHTIICERKKRQAAAKKAREALKRQEEMASGDIQKELPSKDVVGIEDDKICDKEKIDVGHVQVKAIVNELDPKPLATKRKSNENPEVSSAKVRKSESITENKQVTKEQNNTDLERSLNEVLKEEVTDSINAEATNNTNVVQNKDSLQIKTDISEMDTKKPLPPEKDVEASDDDDVRYMLNPDYKRNVFTKVRAKKRNSLQIERPDSKNLRLRRISLPFAPSKAQRSETAPSSEIVSSDEGEIKYSFPRPRKDSTNTEKSNQRKSQSEKRRSIGGVAKRKFLGNGSETKKSPKKRVPEAGHRCDCGQLFGSAALLARHAMLTHTPPRVRRRRSSPPPPQIARLNKKRDTDAKSDAKHPTKPLDTRAAIPKTPRKSKFTSGIPKKSTTSKPSVSNSGNRSGKSRTLANK